MSNLLELAKIDFQASFNIGGKQKEGKKEKKSKSFRTIMILVIVFGTLFSTLYNAMFTFLFSGGGVPVYYSALMFGGATALITLSTSVFKVKSIYMGADYEMLAAMPIKKRDIVASKIISLYLVELLYSAILLVPNMIFVSILGHNALYLVSGILLVFLTPAIPMLLACLIAMFITLVADRFKFGNVINFIFYIILFVCIFYFSFMMQGSNNIDSEGNMDMSNYIRMANIFGWANPMNKIMQLAFENFATNYAASLGFIALYIVLNLAIIVGVVYFLAAFYDKVHALATMQYANEKYVQKNLEVLEQRKTLFVHEAKRFFSSKFYFINSISSGIVAVVMAVMMGLMFSPNSTMVPVTEEVSNFLHTYGYFGFILIAFGIGIATPASVSISIEGKNFWMLKTFPINYKELLRAKFLLSTLVLGVFGYVAAIALCVCIRANWWCYVITSLLSVAYVALSSILSLRINLRRPKLKWKNEQECVKNSKAAILSMLVDWLVMSIVTSWLVGLSMIAVFIEAASAMIYISGITCFFGLVLAAYLFYKGMMKRSDAYFERITDF